MILLWGIVILLVMAIVFGLVALQGWMFMLAWNYLTPWDVTFWQGVVAMILVDLIGQSFRSRS